MGEITALMKGEGTRNFRAILSPIPTYLSVRAESPGSAVAKPTLTLKSAKHVLSFKLLTPDHYQVRTISITITVIALLLILSRKIRHINSGAFYLYGRTITPKNLLYCESR